MIDIGGGSTELVIGEDFEPRLVESRRMGCVSFAQMYFPGGVITRENFQRARMAAVQNWKIWPAIPYSGLERGAGRIRVD